MPSPVFTTSSRTLNPGGPNERRQTLLNCDLSAFAGIFNGQWALDCVATSRRLKSNIWQAGTSDKTYYPTSSNKFFFPYRKDAFIADSSTAFYAENVVFQKVNYNYLGGGSFDTWTEDLVLTISGAREIGLLFPLYYPWNYGSLAILNDSVANAAFSGFAYPLPTHCLYYNQMSFARSPDASLDISKYYLNLFPSYKDGNTNYAVESNRAIIGPRSDRLYGVILNNTDNSHRFHFDAAGNKYFDQASLSFVSGEIIPDAIQTAGNFIQTNGTSTPPAAMSVVVSYYDTTCFSGGASIGSETFTISPTLLDTDGSTYWTWSWATSALRTLTPPTGSVACSISDPDNIVLQRAAIPSHPIQPISGYGTWIPGVLIKA